MTHEKIYKRANGLRVKVSVWLYLHQNVTNWGYLILVQEPTSDTWFDPFSDPVFFEKIKSTDHKTLHENIVSQKEIHQAKIELWMKIRPD